MVSTVARKYVAFFHAVMCQSIRLMKACCILAAVFLAVVAVIAKQSFLCSWKLHVQYFWLGFFSAINGELLSCLSNVPINIYDFCRWTHTVCCTVCCGGVRERAYSGKMRK